MKMTVPELNQFKKSAENVFQAELICSLLEDHPRQLADSELSAIASLIKKLTGDAYVYMNEVIYQQERAKQ
ncbi:hypothetical protein [Klebsiella grimontii]|uniref:hypothetical protein n=1 Tax=Klebsiella grimontii TaxID=2058152 RepID=UPI001D007855|nr:hypothetical protein [Klebsiella grimontii]